MKKGFSVFPQTAIEITSSKNLQTIYDQFYQQLILQDSDTRILFISKDDVKKEYQFEVYKEYIILKGNMGRSVKGNLTGWGVLALNNNKVNCKVFLKTKSWSVFAALSILFFFLLIRIYLAVFFGEVDIRVFLFTTLLIAIGYLFCTVEMKKQIKIVISQIEEALK